MTELDLDALRNLARQSASNASDGEGGGLNFIDPPPAPTRDPIPHPEPAPLPTRDPVPNPVPPVPPTPEPPTPPVPPDPPTPQLKWWQKGINRARVIALWPVKKAREVIERRRRAASDRTATDSRAWQVVALVAVLISVVMVAKPYLLDQAPSGEKGLVEGVASEDSSTKTDSSQDVTTSTTVFVTTTTQAVENDREKSGGTTVPKTTKSTTPAKAAVVTTSTTVKPVATTTTLKPVVVTTTSTSTTTTSTTTSTTLPEEELEETTTTEACYDNSCDDTPSGDYVVPGP